MTGRPAWAATALFSPPGSARYDPDMSEQPGPDKYVETPRDRRIANAVLLLFLVLIVGGGIWLAHAMFDQRALDNCMAQGRTNCAPPIDAPPR